MALSDISIVICTHNRVELLRQTLESIERLKAYAQTIEVCVIANACTDTTAALVREMATDFPFPLRLLEEPVPGLNVARNRGAVEARGKIVAFLDDDVWVSPDWVQGVLAGYKHADVGVVGGRVELWWQAVERPSWFDGRLDSLLSCVDKGPDVVEVNPGSLIGANFSFRKDLWDKAGAFSLKLGRIGNQLLGYEEVEWMERVQQQRYKLVYSPLMYVKHWVAPHRARTPYLIGVAWGNGFSRVMSRKRFTTFRFARSLLGHSYLLVKHTAGGIGAWARRDFGAAVLHATGRATARGGIAGLWKRASTRVNE